jgi:hypothetical protein
MTAIVLLPSGDFRQRDGGSSLSVGECVSVEPGQQIVQVVVVDFHWNGCAVAL